MNDSLDNSSVLADKSYQEYILQGVSRTFALTIPQLPEGLSKVVSNAYLLCRIADTIEDDNVLTSDQTRELSNMFIDVVTGNSSAQTFSDALHPLLSDHTIEAEHDLIKHVPAIIRITHSFNSTQRQALERCIRIMAKGMADYQDAETLEGVEDLPAMDKYCYYVAGVVGEMLTELFCDYSEEINTHREAMIRLAVSFGQGLQMTNILKDIWDDRSRGACWLPRDIFREGGFELRDLQPGCQDENFHRGLEKLIAVACDHLRDALTYTLMIPAQEAGIRRFCLWALGMAILTLNKLNNHLDFSSGAQVKISRHSVKATIFFTSLFVRQDRILRLIFDLMSKNLPVSDIRERLDRARGGAV